MLKFVLHYEQSPFMLAIEITEPDGICNTLSAKAFRQSSLAKWYFQIKGIGFNLFSPIHLNEFLFIAH